MASYQEPPPPYHEEQPMQSDVPPNNTTRFQINRKPVGAAKAPRAISKEQFGTPMLSNREIFNVEGERLKNLNLDDDEAPEFPPRPELSLKTSFPENITDSRIYSSPARTDTGTTLTSISSGLQSSLTASSLQSTSASSTFTTDGSPSSPKSSTSASIQKAYREARHFAGGLIHHPFESTKHFSILRHSHGLVFYQGSSTSLTISIFADAPLPADRTLWLQSKGWTGKAGMRARAFMGRNASWLNVTPTTAVRVEQLKPDDERAWQRDFLKFRKKASRHVTDNHLLRETAVVHIPAEAGDGYFQLVLCLGEKKKVLCPSPVFRLLSTSTSPSSIRGASLSTLPLELGAMVLSIHARSTVGNAVSAAALPFQSQVQQYMPSWWTQEAASAVYGVSGVENKVKSTIGDANNRYDQERDGSFIADGSLELALEQGPIAPYPIRFVARGEISMSTEAEPLSMPAISLAGIPDDISAHLHGYYLGWSRVFQRNYKEKAVEVEPTWCQVIVSALPVDISQLARVDIAQTSKKNITMSLIHDLEELPLEGSQVEVQVMGFIRPDEPLQRANMSQGIQAGDEAAAKAAMIAELNDVSMAQDFLDHPAWHPEVAVRAKAQDERSGRLEKAKMGYANTRMAAQRQIDRVPFHRVGVRVPADRMRDKAVVMSGFYVQR
jgi:hypothetical protein